MQFSKAAALAAVPLMLLASPALAHPGHVWDGGAVAGFLHPVSGLDHMLAMILAGVVAARIGGRALWLIPAAFLAVMTAGAALGVAGLAVPGLEAAIALTAVALLSMAFFSARLTIPSLATLLAALAALPHGMAHGAELPAGAGIVPFIAGFLLSTALLLLAGILVGRLFPVRRLSAERT